MPDDSTINVSCICHDPVSTLRTQIVDLLNCDNVECGISEQTISTVVDEIISRTTIQNINQVDDTLSLVRKNLVHAEGNIMFRINITPSRGENVHNMSTVWFIELSNSERPSLLSLCPEKVERFEAIHKELSAFFGILNSITSHRPIIPYNKSMIASIIRKSLENIDCMVRPIIHLIDSKDHVMEVTNIYNCFSLLIETESIYAQAVCQGM